MPASNNKPRSKPTPEQLAWMDMEMGVIIHCVISAYDSDVKNKTVEVREKLPPSIFCPNGWDTDQWIRSAAAMGAKYAVLSAKHVEGFTLWQTKVNDYSVAGSRYKDGKGDLVRDFIESCKKYGLKPGFYYSTGCNGYYGIDDHKMTDESYKQDFYREYVKNVEAQVKELWSGYGDIFEIWFDGGIVPIEKGGPDLESLLEKYQPNAICFQGPLYHAHNIRWVGNEDGIAPRDCWSSTGVNESFDGTVEDTGIGVGNPDGQFFWPTEADFPNRHPRLSHGGGWIWQPGEKKYAFTKEYLLERYIDTVGRNSNMLVGMGINTDGKFEDEDQFSEFGQLLRETFGEQARIKYVKGDNRTDYRITFDKPTKVKFLVIREDMTEGHRIRGFNVTVDGNPCYKAHCIGHKRIVLLRNALATEVRLEITDYVDEPVLRDIEVF